MQYYLRLVSQMLSFRVPISTITVITVIHYVKFDNNINEHRILIIN